MYNIYMKKTLKHYERKTEQMERHPVFLERDIQHHEKSILLELIYKSNTTSIKKILTRFFFFGRETRKANYKVYMTKNLGE